MKIHSIWLFLMLSFSYCAKSQYSINSWSIRNGYDFSKSYYKSDIFKSHFDSAPNLYDDFSTFHFDGTVMRPFDPPVLFEFDFSIAKENKVSWKDHLEYRFKIGVTTHEIGYDNFLHETYYSDQTVFRDFYGFTMSCTNGYLGTEVMYLSNYIGKKERTKVGYGLGVQSGISETALSVFHLEGLYHVEKDLHDEVEGDYIYYFPAIDVYTNTQYETRGRYFNAGAYVFGFAEKAFFKKRNFLLGFQASFGAVSVSKKSQYPINYSYSSAHISFKFMLGKFKDHSE